MFTKTISKVFGSRNERLIKEMSKTVSVINGLETQMQALSDEDLAAKTPVLRQKLADGASVDSALPEAFAVVREVSDRVLRMRHFDVQLIGGMVLHRGKIAEMRTGEGKTLVATLPVYLNALAGHSVHIVTVNDYLARRDAEWMGQIYAFLGISVGVVAPNMSPEDKRAAYACDVVYGTNNEFGFDYLRDNMAFIAQNRVQGKLTYAIVDEVDSILIDEARTPLIISGAAEDSTALYAQMNKVIPQLKRQDEEDGPGDFSVDEKTRQVYLTDEGHENAEHYLADAGLLPAGTGLYDFSNVSLVHHLIAALRANSLFQRDVDYIVHEGQIVIVDEFTGRMQPGRRWSDGLHQAVEAKENVKVQRENQTLASITFQNYFRLYDRLAGMTGTADTEAEEFQQIYGLEVVVIPTHMLMVRDDLPDLVYRTASEKFKAIVAEISERSTNNQPILVGTASIETSEYLSGLLKRAGIRHEVLNAKQHEREAKIIAQAGRPASVTIATNMAGRGTDIVLGGNLEMELQDTGDNADYPRIEAIKNDWQKRHDAVVAAGGLHVLSTERHESRRVDNQLRGRSGRQGDPGSSRFYLSLEDNLLRIFASDKMSGLMEKLGLEEGEAIEHNWVTKAIENAQRKVEGRNFDIRKQLLEFDDVANEQRKVVYEQRNFLMDSEDVSDAIDEMRSEHVALIINSCLAPESNDEMWDLDLLTREIEQVFNTRLPISAWLDAEPDLSQESLINRADEAVAEHYLTRTQVDDESQLRAVEKAVMLMVLDNIWKDHLSNMDFLRQGIHLRGYAQKNPKQEYKRESYEMFSAMLASVRQEIIRLLFRLEVKPTEDVARIARREAQPTTKMNYIHQESGSALGNNEVPKPEAAVKTYVREQPKVGRNEPCPCGSGKKYKRCCGKVA